MTSCSWDMDTKVSKGYYASIFGVKVKNFRPYVPPKVRVYLLMQNSVLQWTADWALTLVRICESPVLSVRLVVWNSFSLMLSVALYIFLSLLLPTVPARRGKACRNYWGPAVQKGVPWPDYVAKVFFFLGSIIMCRMYKLTLSKQVQGTCNWESVFRI